MKINLNKNELSIIKKSLSDLIEKKVGISQSQEAYIRNIEKGMSKRAADQQFKLDNKKEWEYFVYEEKNPFYCLFDKIFTSPASFRG
tara:strand:+ start:239 stop:499 length:261 start_codon:yes stop_codon:yes gene_type:complete